MADTSSGEHLGRLKRSLYDGVEEKRLKKVLLASLADEYEEAKVLSNDGKAKHGTMTALLKSPTAQTLGIKRHVLLYELEKRKKNKQDEATDVQPLPTTTTNDAAHHDEKNEITDPQMPKKVGRPSLADKAAQAEAWTKIQKAITDAANALVKMRTDARAVGQKAPYGG
jgi:hypothetical protein